MLCCNRVKGWDRLLSQVVSEWTGDVKSQLPKILGGIGPMHYLMQFGNVLILPVLILASDVIVNSSRSRGLCVVAGTAVSTRWPGSEGLTERGYFTSCFHRYGHRRVDHKTSTNY